MCLYLDIHIWWEYVGVNIRTIYLVDIWFSSINSICISPTTHFLVDSWYYILLRVLTLWIVGYVGVNSILTNIGVDLTFTPIESEFLYFTTFSYHRVHCFSKITICCKIEAYTLSKCVRYYFHSQPHFYTHTCLSCVLSVYLWVHGSFHGLLVAGFSFYGLYLWTFIWTFRILGHISSGWRVKLGVVIFRYIPKIGAHGC